MQKLSLVSVAVSPPSSLERTPVCGDTAELQAPTLPRDQNHLGLI